MFLSSAGQKNVGRLKSCHSASTDQQKQMSDLINSSSSSTSIRAIKRPLHEIRNNHNIPCAQSTINASSSQDFLVRHSMVQTSAIFNVNINQNFEKRNTNMKG